MDYITIIQGDDTNFLEDQFLVVNFNTEIDLSGFTATFTLGDVLLTYGDLSGKSFEIILSHDITSNLNIGKQYGELKLIDRNQRIRTLTSVIPFLVRKGVNEDITIVKNSLTVSLNINNTTIDVNIETAGISRTESTRVMDFCNNAQQNAQNYSNSAHNYLTNISRIVDTFNNDSTLMLNAIEQAYNTCNDNVTQINQATNTALSDIQRVGQEQIDLATQQALLAIQEAQEVADKANLDLSNLSSTGQDKFDEKVNKSGDTMVGSLGISCSNPTLILNNTNASGSFGGVNIKSSSFHYTDVTAPAANLCLSRMLFQDADGNADGWVQQYFNTSNQLVLNLGVRRNIGSANKDAGIYIFVDSAGTPYTTAVTPAASATGTHIATCGWVKSILSSSGNGLATFSKAGNGYIKFSNAVTIQWGSFSSGGYKSTKTITYPTAFGSTARVFLCSNYKQSNGDKGSSCSVTSITKTNFVYYSGFEQSSPTVYWFAVGY